MSIFYFNFRGSKLEFFASNPIELQKMFGQGDRRYYLEAGLDLAAHNKIRPEFSWVYVLWPPGMTILNGIIFKITQANNTITLSHAIIASLALSYFFVNVIKFSQIIGVKIGTMFFVSAFYLQSFSLNWFFTDLLFYSDSIGTLIVLTVICKLLIYLNSAPEFIKSLETGLLIGFFLFVSAFMRSPYIVIIQLITYVYILVLALEIFKLFALGLQKYTSRNRQLNNLLLLTSIVFVSSLFSNMWLDFRESNITPGNRSWTATENSAFISPWIPQDQLPGFVRDGGGGWACKIEVEKCQEFSIRESKNERPYSGVSVSNEEYKLETLRTVMHNPTLYVQDRTLNFQKVWFAEAGLDVNQVGKLYESVITLVLFCLFLGYSIYSLRGNYFYFLFHVILFSLLVPYLVFHIEVRYFFVLKIMSLFGIFPSILLLRKIHRIRKKKIDTSNL